MGYHVDEDVCCQRKKYCGLTTEISCIVILGFITVWENWSLLSLISRIGLEKTCLL
jgi:hypothetical protein